MLPRVLLPFQASKLVLQVQVRHAGHNKWSNIRHIKGARDLLVAKVGTGGLDIFNMDTSPCYISY